LFGIHDIVEQENIVYINFGGTQQPTTTTPFERTQIFAAVTTISSDACFSLLGFQSRWLPAIAVDGIVTIRSDIG